MPRKDPMTGCTVLTTAEFLAEEGARDGKTGGEVLDEILDDLEADCERERARLRDPLNALDFLARAVNEENDYLRQENEALAKHRCDKSCPFTEPLNELHPTPVEVIEVLDVQYDATFRETKQAVKARIRVDTGSVGVLTVKSWHSSGSMWEPPDGGTEIEWEAA